MNEACKKHLEDLFKLVSFFMSIQIYIVQRYQYLQVSHVAESEFETCFGPLNHRAVQTEKKGEKPPQWHFFCTEL